MRKPKEVTLVRGSVWEFAKEMAAQGIDIWADEAKPKKRPRFCRYGKLLVMAKGRGRRGQGTAAVLLKFPQQNRLYQ